MCLVGSSFLGGGRSFVFFQAREQSKERSIGSKFWKIQRGIIPVVWTSLNEWSPEHWSCTFFELRHVTRKLLAKSAQSKTH